jgi:NB-ARC domain
MSERTIPGFGDRLKALLNRHGLPEDAAGRWFEKQVGCNRRTLDRWLKRRDVPKLQEKCWPAFVAALRKRSQVPEQLDRDLAEFESWLTQSPARSARDSRRQPDVAAVQRLGNAAPVRIPPLPAQTIQGRHEFVEDLVRQLRLSASDHLDSRPLALWGMPGIGKTTVLNALAHKSEIQDWFSGGIVWVSVGPRPSVRRLLTEIGSEFGVDLLPATDDAACVDRLRSALHRRRALLLIDDLWDAAHGRQFLLTGPQGRTILTTRESLVAYPLVTRARSLRVQELDPKAALAILHDHAPEAVERECKLAEHLCQKLGYLPLAINLAGRLIAQEADVPGRVRTIINELIKHRSARLHLTQDEQRPGLDPKKPRTVQAIIGMSVERLQRRDQDRFAVLSVFGAEPLWWPIDHAATVWHCSVREAELTTSRLIQRGLVELRDDRYWMHALIADYAGELARSRGL